MPELELGDLYEEFEQDMLRFGTSIGGSRDAAEDLVHETFLRARLKVGAGAFSETTELDDYEASPGMQNIGVLTL